MSNLNQSSVLKWVHPIYEIIFEIKKPYFVNGNSRKGSSLMKFDTITIINPNGTILKYSNQYQFLIHSGSYKIENYIQSQVNNFTIEIHRMTQKGWFDWDIGMKNTFSISKHYIFNFHIKIPPDQSTLTLNCTKIMPCVIIVRQTSEKYRYSKV